MCHCRGNLHGVNFSISSQQIHNGYFIMNEKPHHLEGIDHYVENIIIQIIICMPKVCNDIYSAPSRRDRSLCRKRHPTHPACRRYETYYIHLFSVILIYVAYLRHAEQVRYNRFLHSYRHLRCEEELMKKK